MSAVAQFHPAQLPSTAANAPSFLEAAQTAVAVNPAQLPSASAQAQHPQMYPQKFIRLPPYIREALGIPHIALPLLNSNAINETMFVTRAALPFRDTEALIAGERPFVRSALFRSAKVVVVRDVARPPLIVFFDLHPVILPGSAASRISWISPAVKQTLEVELTDESAQELAIAQCLTEIRPPPENHVMFRTNGVLQYLTTLNSAREVAQNHSIVFYPMQQIVTSMHRTHQLTVRLKKDSAAFEIARHIMYSLLPSAFTYVNALTSIRVLLPDMASWPTINELAKNLRSRFADEVVDIKPDAPPITATTARTRYDGSAAPNDNKVNPTHVIMATTNGSHIPRLVCETILKTLDLRVVRYDVSRCIAKAKDEETASKLHLLLINDKYLICAAIHHHAPTTTRSEAQADAASGDADGNDSRGGDNPPTM